MFFPYAIDEEVDYEGVPILLYFFCFTYLAVHFALYKYYPESFRDDIFYTFGAVPSDFKWWTPITCTFFHAGWLHLLGNLYFFWIYGRLCEKALGLFRFISIYIIGAYVSILAHCIAVPEYMGDIPTIGASGAISAVLGAFLVLFPAVKVKMVVFSIIFPRPLPTEAPAYFILGSWFILQLASGLQIMGESTEVAFWAHIAGFAVGAVLGTVYLVMHQKAVELMDKKFQPHLLHSWEMFWNDETDEAKKEFFKSTSDKARELPENSGLINALLAGELDGDTEISFKNTVSYFTKAKDKDDYAAAFQAYYWLTRISNVEDIPAKINLEGALAAARLGHYDFALTFLKRAIDSASPENSAGIINLIARIMKKKNQDKAA